MANSSESRLLSDVVHHCRSSSGSRFKLADSTGATLSGKEVLVRALALRAILRRHYLSPDEQYVGILMPPTVAGAVVNVALAFDKRVSVNLNFVLSSDQLQHCIDLAGIRHVITSRKVLERLEISFNATTIILEDLPGLVRSTDKVAAAALGIVSPVPLLERALGLDDIESTDLLTVLFTSGATGDSKGVMLTHANIGSNCVAIRERIGIRNDDVLLGILPFFHAFGLTVTMWMALASFASVVYHPNPLETDEIARLAREHQATMLLATPTLLRLYADRIAKDDFASLNMVAAGAERLRSETADEFESRFGIRPFEGYGVTEASPAIAFNVPPDRWEGDGPAPIRNGTVGQAIPGLDTRVIDRDTGEVIGPGSEGTLQVRGPNIMLGYLHRPDLTAKVLDNGWYDTGDVVTVDTDGFITITGRISQFSKIGGETVPHLLIEEHINAMLRQLPGEVAQVAVTAVPDSRRGERIVVVHTPMSFSPATVTAKLRNEGLPALFVPADDSFVEVDALPILGTGKTDLRALQNIARSSFNEEGRRLN